MGLRSGAEVRRARAVRGAKAARLLGERTASAGRLARRGSIEPTHALDRCRADGNCREVLTPINPSGDFFEDED